ncbi:MAG: hypothetical protein LBH87_02650 [Coriobacteriales bacterium]|nr:hypothetical protein [Coriobacteriales bacterium]
MDEENISRKGRYSIAKIVGTLDGFLVNRLHFTKADDGFYLGSGSTDDFANFGVAMTTLGKKHWFMDNVKTWLYFNSEDSELPDDFVIEDFKELCLNHYRMAG